MVIGILLGLLGIWWYVPGGGANSVLAGHSTLTNYESFMAMVQGSIGVLAVIIGLFVAWIEHDAIKVERELQAEDRSSVQPAEGAVDVADGTAADTRKQTDSDTYTCDACDRSFDTKRGLNVHRAQVHED